MKIESKDQIIKKLVNTLSSSKQNRSDYWERQLTNQDKNNKMDQSEIYKITSTGGWGNFTNKHFIKSKLHELGQLYVFGPKLFKSKIYKMYKEVFDKYNRQIDYHVVKHILMIERIEKFIKNSERICVIGDGKLNFLLGASLLNPNAQLFYINLPEVLINDYMVMNEMNYMTDKVDVVENFKDTQYSKNTRLYLIPASQALFCKNKDINFFFNSHSMQEMSYKEIEKYFEIIKSNKAYFYCNNREQKPKIHNSEDYYFEKMPWENCDFLFKEQCPINIKHYNFRPPFIRKFDKMIHCLAKFN